MIGAALPAISSHPVSAQTAQQPISVSAGLLTRALDVLLAGTNVTASFAADDQVAPEMEGAHT